MRKFAKWLLVLGVVALPLPAQAQYYYPNQYYYNPAPAYYYAPPRPMYYPSYAPTYSYYQPPLSYSYPRAYPSMQYGAPMNVYPSTSYYPPAKPMPTGPTVYYVQSPQPAPTNVTPPPAAPMPSAPTSISQPPITEVPGGGADFPFPVQPEYNPHHGNGTPETMVLPPQDDIMPHAPTLPAPCAGCKANTLVDGTLLPGACHGSDCFDDCKKPKRCHFDVFGEYLYWNVRNADIPFAQAFDGIDPLAVPRGPVGMDLPKYSSGFRIGAGASLSDCSWLVGTFTYYDNNTDATLGAGPGNVLHAFLVFPSTVNAAPDSLTASANYDIRLLMGDVDYKCAFVNTDQILLNWLAGARFAHLEQGMNVNYDILGKTSVDSHVNFDGFGARAGLEGEYRVRGGFYGYGKGIVNLLAGHFSANYVQQNVFAGLQAQSQFGEDRLVPVLEFEAGGGWISPSGHIRISGGYYVGSWFNTLTMPNLVRGIQNNDFTTNSDNFRDTLTFDGLVGRIEIRY
jgi:hypothetical protein